MSTTLDPNIVDQWLECQQRANELLPDNPDVAQSAAATLLIAHQKDKELRLRFPAAFGQSPPIPRTTAGAAPTQQTAPAPASQPGVLVTGVQPFQGVSKKTGKPFVKHTITFSDGTKADTFKTELATLASDAAAAGQRVLVTIKPNANPQYAGDLASIQVA